MTDTGHAASLVGNGKWRLFHTGQVEIRTPDLRHGRKNADFGPGFYLTPDEAFSLRWARRDAVINEYELDTEGLDICFLKRDERWAEYIFGNRRLRDTVTADIVAGPIANDTIFDTLGIISSGLLKPEEALRLLLIGPEYTQVAIKTDRALRQLKWIRSFSAIGGESSREEQEAYQKQLGEVLEEIAGK